MTTSILSPCCTTSSTPHQTAHLIGQLTSGTAISCNALNAPASPETIVHRNLLEGEFWRHIPSYSGVDTATFLDHAWQARHTVTRPQQLRQIVGGLLPGFLYRDVVQGLRHAPMSIRISPYILALINWENSASCPIRRQFLPLTEPSLDDHPKLH